MLHLHISRDTQSGVKRKITMEEYQQRAAEEPELKRPASATQARTNPSMDAPDIQNPTPNAAQTQGNTTETKGSDVFGPENASNTTPPEPTFCVNRDIPFPRFPDLLHVDEETFWANEDDLFLPQTEAELQALENEFRHGYNVLQFTLPTEVEAQENQRTDGAQLSIFALKDEITHLCANVYNVHFTHPLTYDGRAKALTGSLHVNDRYGWSLTKRGYLVLDNMVAMVQVQYPGNIAHNQTPSMLEYRSHTRYHAD